MTTCRPIPAYVHAWMASRCCDLIGRTRMARLVGVDVEDMRRVACGYVVPTQRQREAIDHVFASLLFVELEDEGVRVVSESEHKQVEEDKRL